MIEEINSGLDAVPLIDLPGVIKFQVIINDCPCEMSLIL